MITNILFMCYSKNVTAMNALMIIVNIGKHFDSWSYFMNGNGSYSTAVNSSITTVYTDASVMNS